MKVSVILPIYNGESTLIQTLDSLADQTFKDFELIACIDGTKDASKEILEKFRLKFSKLIILENKYNLGLGPTMNRLVANTCGEYIAIAEQDDFYYPSRLELQVNLLDEREDVGLVSGIAEFWDGEKVTMKFPGILVNGGQYPEGKDFFLLNYINQTKVVNSCMMFRKKIHIENGLYFSQHYPNIPVDWAYFLRFSLKSKIFGLQTILVRLDRKQARVSITTKKELNNLANRELLRSFYFEFPEIIDNKIYTKALKIQKARELSILSGKKFVYSFLKNVFRTPTNIHFYKILNKRIKLKLKF